MKRAAYRVLAGLLGALAVLLALPALILLALAAGLAGASGALWGGVPVKADTQGEGRDGARYAAEAAAVGEQVRRFLEARISPRVKSALRDASRPN